MHSCAHGASVLESDLDYEPSLLADAPALESEPELILNPDQELPVPMENLRMNTRTNRSQITLLLILDPVEHFVHAEV